MRRWIIVLTALLLASLGLFAAGSTMAQQGATPIAVGETVEGEITSSDYQQLYTLTATAGESVTITMTGDGELDSYLLVQDSNENVLTEDDDSAGGTDAKIAFTVGEDGDYTIVATRSGFKEGSSTGSYQLTVDSQTGTSGESANKPNPQKTTVQATESATEESGGDLGFTLGTPEAATEEAPVEETPPEEEATPTPRPTRARATATKRASKPAATPNPIVEGGEITDGQSVEGQIDDAQIAYVYTYQGTADEQLTITMEGQDGLEPTIVVFPPENDKPALKTASAKASQTSVTMEVTLPADGQYFIVATRVGGTSGDTTGAFTLTLSVGPASAQEIDISGDPSDVVASLQAAGVVPKGGKLVATLPSNSFTRASTPGFKYLTIIRTSVKNFVLNFQVGWTTAGDASGCGMGFRHSGTQQTSFVLLTNDGKVALAQWEGKTDVINYLQDSNLFSTTEFNTVTVAAIEDTVTVFVNGKFQTTQKGKAVKGVFDLMMYNPEGNTTVTNCRLPTGWVWSFDK